MSLNSFRNGFQKVLGTKIGYAIVAVIAILLVFSFVYSGLGNNVGAGRGGAAGGGQGGTVATVNGSAITRGDFDQETNTLQQQAQQFGQTISPLRSALLHATALDELITAKLELQAADRMGLKVSDSELNKARLAVVAQAGLAQKLNLKPNASLTQIDAALTQNGQPTVEDNLPDAAIRENVLQDKLQTYEANKVVVTPQDARNFYQEWHTRHILIDNKTRSDAQAQSQAQQILTKAKAPGADFAALAKQYSDDPGTKNSGGDDGWIGADNQFNNYVPEFVQAVKSLKPGGITLIKSPHFGYFIIQLEAIRSNLPKDFDKNTAKYIDQVKQQEQSQAMQDFVTALKNDPHNKIVVTDPELRADRTMAAAATESDPVKQQADYRAAIADYQKALAAKPAGTVAGEINVQIGQAYQALHQTPQAIAAFETALQTTDDPDLRMELGNLYLQNKQDAKAAAQFQAASSQSWDNQALHQQLMMTYLQMKRPDLVAHERDWLKQYQDRQKQMQAAPPMGGGLGNVASTPAPAASTPAKPPTPQAVQVVPSPVPGAATVIPASGGSPPSGKKPAQ